MRKIQLLLTTTVLGCAVMAHAALAQDASAQTANSTGQSGSNVQALHEVVVTAEHRSSTGQKTAAAISVLAGADMQLEGRYDLSAILEDVPGLVGGAASNVNTSVAGGTDNPATGLTIRGVQANSGAGGSITSTASTAAIYVDDVYNGIGGAYDIDRVEVLRGPQGTLYGRSAAAGVVTIHTHDPVESQLGADATAEYGNYNLRHFTGDVNLPLIKDTLALRLAGNLYERDGYYTADGAALKNSDFRAKLLWNPTEHFSALLGYAQDYNLTHSGGISISQGSSPSDFLYTPQAISPPGKNDFHQFWGNFNLDLGSVAVTYIPGYRTWYQNTTVYARSQLFNANQTVFTPTDWFLTQELRIKNTNPDAKLKWQAGVLYYDNLLSNVNNLLLVPNGPYAFKSASRKSTEAEGAFTEATYAFAPDTRLTVGLRYDHTEILNTENYTSILGITQSLTGDQGQRKFNNFNYKLRLEHDITPHNLVYGTVATGFSPGDVVLTTDQTFHPQVQVLRSETLTAYEVGSKNRFLENRLQVNGDLYFNDYGAYQTAGINTSPQTPQTPTFNTISAPMKSYGAELEVQARPWANGTVSLSGSYTHARYGSFGQFAPLFSHNDVPGVAPVQGSIAYDHRLALGTSTLMLHADVRYFSAHDTSAITQQAAAMGAGPFVHVQSEAVGNVDATLMLPSHYTITAYVRNIADNRFVPDGWGVAGVVPGPGPGAAPMMIEDNLNLSDPRTVGVILSVKY